MAWARRGIVTPMPNTHGAPSRLVGHARAHPALGIVAAVGAYEVVADVLNDTLGAPLLPSMRKGLERFSWAGLGRRMVPKWSLQAGLVAVGFAGAMAVRARRSPARTAVQTSKR
jgi:hypothetical protein